MRGKNWFQNHSKTDFPKRAFSNRDRGAVKMRTERNKWEIIIDVLEVIRAEEKAKKTRIMHMAYLDWRNFRRHFNFLIEEGFIMKCNPDNECYKLTENGDNLLKKLNEVNEILR